MAHEALPERDFTLVLNRPDPDCGWFVESERTDWFCKSGMRLVFGSRLESMGPKIRIRVATHQFPGSRKIRIWKSCLTNTWCVGRPWTWWIRHTQIMSNHLMLIPNAGRFVRNKFHLYVAVEPAVS